MNSKAVSPAVASTALGRKNDLSGAEGIGQSNLPESANDLDS